MNKEFLYFTTFDHEMMPFFCKNTKERSDFLKKVEKLMMKLVSHAPVDAAVDQVKCLTADIFLVNILFTF